MPARRRSRQRALQVLYQWDARKQSIEEAVESFYVTLYSAEDDPGKPPAQPPQDPFMESLARGTAACAAELDQLIASRAENWRVERMPIVDRNILRMAIFEMRDLGTPPAIVIDEALEIARRYSEEEALPFINGVLDAVRRLILPESVAAP
ncbi:MAG: transcription antitermination factor NusB [Bryobacterales bacterium]|nr:transcription antitermination factor NusB [Bryobacterales bacterium]